MSKFNKLIGPTLEKESCSISIEEKRRMELVNASMEVESKLTPKSYEEIRRRSTKRRSEQLKAAEADFLSKKIKMSRSSNNGMSTVTRNLIEEWETIVCKKCDTYVVYPSRELYESHMNLCHPVERPHRCSHCEKSFPTAYKRKQHEATHKSHNPVVPTKKLKEEAKLHLCEICDRSFQSKTSLSQHRLTDHLHPDTSNTTEDKMKNLWKLHLAPPNKTNSNQSDADVTPQSKTDAHKKET